MRKNGTPTVCKSFEFTELYSRRHDGYSVTFFGYPSEDSADFNAALEVAGTKKKKLVQDLLAAIAAAWPDKDLNVVVDEEKRIVAVN
jgi:hypothetical protein